MMSLVIHLRSATVISSETHGLGVSAKRIELRQSKINRDRKRDIDDE